MIAQPAPDLQTRLEPGLHAVDHAAGGRQLRRARWCRSAPSPPGTTVLNVYAGTPESGGADFFTYKNVLYTLVKSGGHLRRGAEVLHGVRVEAGRDSAAARRVRPERHDLPGDRRHHRGRPAHRLGSIRAPCGRRRRSPASRRSSVSSTASPRSRPTSRSSGTGLFQFQAADPSGTDHALRHHLHARAATRTWCKVDVPALLPTFTQAGPFTFTPSYPLTFETGGYNAFTTFVEETSTPSLSFAAAYKTPVTSTDPLDRYADHRRRATSASSSGTRFRHRRPWPIIRSPTPRAPASPLVYFVDVDFEDDSNIYVEINNTVLHARRRRRRCSRRDGATSRSPTSSRTPCCARARGFEVKKGDNYNFNRDFSIAMTFASPTGPLDQGLLYKGTGSDITTPQLSMSYRVGVQAGHVTLQFTDAAGTAQPAVHRPGDLDQPILPDDHREADDDAGGP